MMHHRDFAVFILSHGRADNVITMKTLSKGRYSGRTYIIIDDEDEQADRYFDHFGDKVIQFSKKEAEGRTDKADCIPDRKSEVFARNMCWDIARRLGLEYFLMFEDDYTAIQYRYEQDGKLKKSDARNLDDLFDAFLDYLDSAPQILTVAMAQGGDFIGGLEKFTSVCAHGMRKAMNSFFCRTDRPFSFYGRMNDDVTTYLTLGSRGYPILSHPRCMVVQARTQASPGGLTDMYRQFGTYTKSFYSLMYTPSCLKIKAMICNNMRIHHQTSWNNAVPKIVPERCCKGTPVRPVWGDGE